MARAAAAIGLLSLGLLAFTIPAAATGGDSVTVDNAAHVTLRHARPVSLSGTAHANCGPGAPATRDVSLNLVGPAGKHSSTRMLQSVRRPCAQEVTLSDRHGAPNRNGSYRVTLVNGSASRTSSAKLDVLIPPAAPKDLTVQTSGTIVSFTWSANSEPDVTAYQVQTSYGYVVTTVTPQRACSGTTCAAATNMGQRAAGSTVNFQIRAFRCGRSCRHDVKGPLSPPVSGTFTGVPPPPSSPAPSAISAPPGASPPPAAGGGGGRGAAPAGSGSPGSQPGRAGHRHHASARPHHGSASASPTAGAGSGPGQPPANPLQQRSGGSQLADSVQSARVWRTIAAAVILLLLAFHLRTWVRRVEPT